MKRTLIATGIAAIVFGGVYGLAASLGVNSDTLGGGTDVVAACQDATLFPVNVGYTPSYAQAQPGYETTTVNVVGLEASCDDKSIKVTLTGAGNAALGEDTDVTGTAGSVAMQFPGVAAEDVLGVHVTIYG